MASLSPEIADELHQLVQQAIQKDCQLTQLPELKFKLIYSDDRKIYKIKVDQHEQFYVLKVRGQTAVKALDMSLEDLQKEYDLLSQAWQSGQHLDTGLSMSAPIAIWPDHKSILLSGCEGKNLNDEFNQHLIKWAVNASWLKNMIGQCGLWLGNFHHHSCQISDITESMANRRKNLQRMLGVLAERQANPLSQQQLKNISVCFDKLSQNQSQQLQGLVHGNFAYRNVLGNSQQLNLVDFEDAHIEHPGYDMGQFIAEILFKSQFPWLRHQTPGLIDEFLNKYRQHQDIDDQLLQAYIGYHLVVHLYEHCTRRPAKFPKSMLMSFRIRYLANLIKSWLVQNQ